MELQKIALIGAYISFLWFIPVLYISKKPYDWKIKKLRLFTFMPTIGAFMFVIGISTELFIAKDFISFGFNQFNILLITFLFLQAFITLFMEISLSIFQKKSEFLSNKKVRKLENTLYIGLTILFALDMLVRFEIYRLTF